MMKKAKAAVFMLIILSLMFSFVNIHAEKEYTAPKLNSKYYNEQNPFAPTYKGQCTWYAWGRTYEKTKKKPIEYYTPRGQYSFYGHAKYWWDDNQSLLKSGTGYICSTTTPMKNSILVWGASNKSLYGHVAFLEMVDDKYLYVTQANLNGKGEFDSPEWKTIEYWNNWLGMPFNGYIYTDVKLADFKAYVASLPVKNKITYNMKEELEYYYNIYLAADATSKDAIGNVTRLKKGINRIKEIENEMEATPTTETTPEISADTTSEAEVEPTKIELEGISFEKNKYIIKVGKSKKPKVGIVPVNADDVTLKFVSMKKNIATVNEKGRIYAKKKGKVYVVAKANGKRGTCLVKIK